MRRCTRLMSSLASSKSQAGSAAGYAIGFENAVEQTTPTPLRVKGQIPPWLRGRLYRTGPGTFRVPSAASPTGSVDLTHWFDGLGMTHRFEISDGGVMYSNRKTARGIEERLERNGKMLGVAFGDQDPCESIFKKFFTMFKPHPDAPPAPGKGRADDANVSVTLTSDMPGFASHSTLPSPKASNTKPRYLVAKSDNDALQILDPDTLTPLHATTYAELDPRLDGQISAAHSCRDKTTGEFFNYSLKFGGRPTYKIFCIKPDEHGGYETRILAEIKDAPPAYLHSSVMTGKYVVLCVWQADFQYYGSTIPLNRSIAGSIGGWNPKRDALFYVIDRKNGGVVAKYKTPPFFCFHALNAYDRVDDIVIDLSVYDDHSVINLLYLKALRNLDGTNVMKMGRARRFVLESVRETESSTREAKVQWTLPQSSSIELPTVHPGSYHRPYRYAYGMNKLDPKTHHTFADRIIKLDFANHEAEPKAWGVPGYTPGEPIFVPRPSSPPVLPSTQVPEESSEDDGVLLSVVLDASTQKSMLVVLDAKNMEEIARAEMDTHFPFVFHGVWTQA